MSKTLALFTSHFILLGVIGFSAGGSDSTVDPSNDVAMANAGPELIVEEDAPIRLDATPNSTPIAGNACYKTPLNEGLTGKRGGQVRDADDTSFNFVLVSGGEPTKGKVTINGQTGEFTYTPNQGARGADRFTYEVVDHQGRTDTAEVTVIVGNTRIMPLGDSITAGVGNESDPDKLVDYRGPLFDALTADGFAVDFVGGQAYGFAAEPSIGDPDNEGHLGKRDKQLAKDVYGLLSANPADIVLLHIGTNGLDRPDATASTDVEQILNATGYAKMAETWFKAIKDSGLIPRCEPLSP